MRSNRFPLWMMCSTLGLVSASAYADPSAADKEQAKKLYQQATADMARQAYPRACPRFEAALQLHPQHVRTAISLGTCEDRWGKLVNALQRFEYARSLAILQSAADKIVEIDGLTADLIRRTPQLLMIVPERIAAISNLTVFRNGTLVPSSEYGKTIRLDPGSYEITASSPTTGAWKANIDMHLGETAEVTIGGSPTATYRANQNADEFGASSRSSSSPDNSGNGLGRRLGFAGIGIGAAGIVAGSIMGGLAISNNSASDNGHCDAANYCDKTGTTLRLDAQRYANVSTALFIGGGVLLAGGIILVVTAPSKTNTALSNPTTSLWIGPGSIGLRGSW